MIEAKDRYLLNTRNNEIVDRFSESLTSMKKRIKLSRKCLVSISEKEYTKLKAKAWVQEFLSKPEVLSFFQNRASRYKVSTKQLIELWDDQDGECALCGDKLAFDKTTHIDHIVPRKLKGKDEIENYQFVCAKCNYAKRELTTKEFILMCLKVELKHRYTIPKAEKMELLQRIWRTEGQEKAREKYKDAWLKELQNQESGSTR